MIENTGNGALRPTQKMISQPQKIPEPEGKSVRTIFTFYSPDPSYLPHPPYCLPAAHSLLMDAVMMNSNLQQIYERAVASVQNKPAPKLPAKKTPIFQRTRPRSESEAVKDAASALAALWKMTPRAATR